MLITGLSYAVNGSEVDVYLDNSRSSRLLLDSIAEFKLYQGKDINSEEFERIIVKDLESRLFKKAINYISIRPRTESEINYYFLKQKLISDNANKELIIQCIIDRLKSNSYLDDEKFCEWLIENRINCSLKSRAEVKNEMMHKGISSSIINIQIDKFYPEEEELEIFETIFKKRYRNITNIDKKTKLKIFNYFQRRGFNYSIIKEKLNI